MLAKYATLILYEMYIKEGLVFNIKHSGEMVGFVDLGEVRNHAVPMMNTNCVQNHLPKSCLLLCFTDFLTVRNLFMHNNLHWFQPKVMINLFWYGRQLNGLSFLVWKQ